MPSFSIRSTISCTGIIVEIGHMHVKAVNRPRTAIGLSLLLGLLKANVPVSAG